VLDNDDDGLESGMAIGFSAGVDGRGATAEEGLGCCCCGVGEGRGFMGVSLEEEEEEGVEVEWVC